MALPVIEADGLDAVVAPQGPGQADAGVLAAREQDDGAARGRAIWGDCLHALQIGGKDDLVTGLEREMDETVVLYTTWPNPDAAEAFAAEAVSERLAACANILPPIMSIYRWEGAIERDVETVMLLKTTAEAASALTGLILARHPYRTACVVAFKVDTAASSGEFLAWIKSEVAGGRPEVSDQ
jgi:periplasmic divalent cation tolerance protein